MIVVVSQTLLATPAVVIIFRLWPYVGLIVSAGLVLILVLLAARRRGQASGEGQLAGDLKAGAELAAPGAHFSNMSAETVEGFGDEWTRFDQSELSPSELRKTFESFFGIFPWSDIGPNAEGIDVGCGSGRWAKLVAPSVGTLHCVDASEAAMIVARRNLAGMTNCRFHIATVSDMPFPDESADFVYSIGVLHHIPDTAAGIRACVAKLKKGAPFLVYLYYAFDNRPLWFRLLWRLTVPGRYFISRAPHSIRYAISQLIAGFVYWPVARSWALLERAGVAVEGLPLSWYRDRTFYYMRTDALDRFGTRLEHRFTRAQIERMLREAGLDDIRFSDSQPFWCAVAKKK